MLIMARTYMIRCCSDRVILVYFSWLPTQILVLCSVGPARLLERRRVMVRVVTDHCLRARREGLRRRVERCRSRTICS